MTDTLLDSLDLDGVFGFDELLSALENIKVANRCCDSPLSTFCYDERNIEESLLLKAEVPSTWTYSNEIVDDEEELETLSFPHRHDIGPGLYMDDYDIYSDEDFDGFPNYMFWDDISSDSDGSVATPSAPSTPELEPLQLHSPINDKAYNDFSLFTQEARYSLKETHSGFEKDSLVMTPRAADFGTMALQVTYA